MKNMNQTTIYLFPLILCFHTSIILAKYIINDNLSFEHFPKNNFLIQILHNRTQLHTITKFLLVMLSCLEFIITYNLVLFYSCFWVTHLIIENIHVMICQAKK